MRSFTTSIHRSLLAPLAFAGGLAACSGQVDVTPGAGGSGAGGSPSSTTTSASPTSASTSSSTGTGGSGGSSIGPLTCLPGEGAIVVGSSSYQSAVAVAVLDQGTWTEAAGVVPTARYTAAYVDVYNQLAVFWLEQKGVVDQAHFARTKDGTAFDFHDVDGWHPLSSPLFRANDSTLVGRDAQGTSLAYYDSDAMDWYAWQSAPLPFTVSSAATLATSGAVVLVGFNNKQELCDVTLDAGAAWGAPSCHPELHVTTGQEIPSPPPQLVALPSGDAVAVYFTSYGDLTATVLHDGQWSAPITTTLPDHSLSFAVTSTPAGDVIAGVVLTLGDVAALRFSPAAGWAAPIAIDTYTDTGIGFSKFQEPAAATGICGDDALFAYLAGGIDGEVRVARVRGDAAETTKVAKFVEDIPVKLSLATRRYAQSP
jgi:hypothetical protein